MLSAAAAATSPLQPISGVSIVSRSALSAASASSSVLRSRLIHAGRLHRHFLLDTSFPYPRPKRSRKPPSMQRKEFPQKSCFQYGKTAGETH